MGRVALANTHPFRFGPWAFAHNGTIPAFDEVRRVLPLGDLGPPTGATDSEWAFRRLVFKMESAGLDPLRPADDVPSLVRVVSGLVVELARTCRAVGAGEPARLSFVVGDGRHLVATRWGRPLWWACRRGIPDCALCGGPHLPDLPDYRAVVVASEPITAEPWLEIPDGTVLAIDARTRVTRWDPLARAA